MKSLTLPDSYSPENFAEGILYYGSSMFSSAQTFKAWLCYNVIIYPRSGDEKNEDIIREVWGAPEVKEAFDKLNVHVQVKTVKNWLPNFTRNALPLIKKHGFEKGCEEAITNYGGALLRSPESPKRGTADGCRHCTKHNCPKE